MFYVSHVKLSRYFYQVNRNRYYDNTMTALLHRALNFYRKFKSLKVFPWAAKFPTVIYSKIPREADGKNRQCKGDYSCDP